MNGKQKKRQPQHYYIHFDEMKIQLGTFSENFKGNSPLFPSISQITHFGVYTRTENRPTDELAIELNLVFGFRSFLHTKEFSAFDLSNSDSIQKYQYQTELNLVVVWIC